MQTMLTATLSDVLQPLCDALASFNRLASLPGAVIRGERFNPMDGEPEPPGDPSRLLIEAISAWDIGPESCKGSVYRFPGVFEVTEPVIQAASQLNQAKLLFSSTVTALEASGIDRREIRQAYRAFGLPRLHPLQAWREIVLLEEPGLTSIGFTVVKGGQGIEVLTLAQTLGRLRQANAYDVIEQLQGLAESSTIHWHLPVCRHVRANVVWQREKVRATKMYHASLPFLVAPGNWPSKRVRFNQPREHAKRSDAKGVFLARLPLRQGAYLSMGD